MLEKIKSLIEVIKGVLVYIAAPLGVIYYLLNRDVAKIEKKVEEGKKNLEVLGNEQKDIDRRAADAVNAFEEFRRSSDGSGKVQDSGGSSDSGPKGSN